MEYLTVSTFDFVWDPASRLMEIRVAPQTEGKAADARTMMVTLSRWVGESGERFGTLCNLTGLVGIDSEYRAVWGDFYKKHRDHTVLALVGLSPIIRVVAEMFRIATGLKMKFFDDEALGREWLRAMGIG